MGNNVGQATRASGASQSASQPASQQPASQAEEPVLQNSPMAFPLTAALSLAAGLPAAPAEPRLVNPCLNATFKSAKFCDPTVGLDDRAADIVSRLTIAEKINALGTNTGALPSVGLPPYNWWSEATHGISHVRDGPGSSTPYETNFALPITTANSFNRSMWKVTGRAIGVEARAFMNAGNAYSTYWAPVINLVRDPRWGRNIETPGEGVRLIRSLIGLSKHLRKQLKMDVSCVARSLLVRAIRH